MPHEDSTFELVVVSNEFCTPSVLNTKIDGIDAYATSDLFLPHPTMPVPLENMLSQDPHVRAAVMFGCGHFQVGILVEPKSPYQFYPVNDKKLRIFGTRFGQP
ncbi:hypothetical protein J3R30DRAFT_3406051 [Lentinula aciculospora]|uniref:Uncharacterized protein n=1 Tax=Lentinula aciculospora TaxID=153920 RepID=A0A9W9A6U2_9AGAR|nr:hypothetical protein J3R30DRAFT_3406051 [Lentinula aciculospora]